MPAGEYAAHDRETGVLFRMSLEEKERLKNEAAAHGLTMQALMERRVLGKEDAEPRRPGRTPKPQQEMLPLQHVS